MIVWDFKNTYYLAAIITSFMILIIYYIFGRRK